MNKQNFYDLNFDQLKNFLIEKAEIDDKKAKMRAQQMFNAVYKKNIKNFDELTTFGLGLREKIKHLISLKKPKRLSEKELKNPFKRVRTECRTLSAKELTSLSVLANCKRKRSTIKPESSNFSGI